MINYLLPILLLLFIGCGDTTTENKPPVASIVPTTTSLHTSETLSLSASTSTDSDGDIVRYEWIENNQRFGTESITTWTAPDTADNYIITLKVTDDDGATTSIDIMIVVTATPNTAPTASIVATDPSIFLGNSVTLDASGSIDDGNIVSYLWKTGDNQTIGNTEVFNWTPQKVDNYTITLTVTDDDGTTASNSIMISVNQIPNQTPVAHIENATFVSLGQQISLDGSGSSDDGTLTYLWSNQLGTASITTWTAPTTPGSHTISLTVTDDKGLTNTATTTITVLDAASSFSDIQTLIESGTATYICVGDSTRTDTTTPEDLHNQSRDIFETMQTSLQTYGVNSILFAQGGLMFKTFNGDDHYSTSDSRTWINIQDMIAQIPDDGNSSIVNVSLASNDYSALFHLDLTPADIHLEIKTQLLRMISTILDSKPQTKMMLTSPNPFRDWKIASDTYQAVYQEVSDELGIPFANFIAQMPQRGSTDFKAWYLDGIHFNTTIGLPAVSSFVLTNILPTVE